MEISTTLDYPAAVLTLIHAVAYQFVEKRQAAHDALLMGYDSDGSSAPACGMVENETKTRIGILRPTIDRL